MDKLLICFLYGYWDDCCDTWGFTALPEACRNDTTVIPWNYCPCTVPANKKRHVVSTASFSTIMVVKTDCYYVLVLPLLLCLVRVLPWFWSYYSLWESIICTWTKKDLLSNCNGSKRAIMICHVKNAHAYSRYKQICAKSFIHKARWFC